MDTPDVVVAGGGVAGLLVASVLSPHRSVLLLEQHEALPRNKCWLTDENALRGNISLEPCVERRYEFLDFITYDGLTATVQGQYCIWNTDALVDQLSRAASARGVQIPTGHRLYSISQNRNEILIRANSRVIKSSLLSH